MPGKMAGNSRAEFRREKKLSTMLAENRKAAGRGWPKCQGRRQEKAVRSPGVRENGQQ